MLNLVPVFLEQLVAYRDGTARDPLLEALRTPARELAPDGQKELLRWAGLLALCGLIFIAPGWALLGWLWKGWDELSWLEQAGLAGGFSLAANVLGLVFTDLLGLHLGAWYAWGAMICALVSLAWRAITRYRRRRGTPSLKTSPSWSIRPADIAIVVVLVLIMVTRWWAIREIEAPMWGDAVQHTFITQLILDERGLFTSWEPYAPYATFGNQFGFPTAAALLAWTSGMDAAQAVLWSGQVLNVLAVLVLYPLAVRMAKGQRWAGVGAVFAAGLISNMPAFYFNWGRYAQLAGQVMLPVVMWMTWEVIEGGTANHSLRIRALPWAKLGLSAVALCGMVMTQYRTPFYMLTFLLACLIGWWIPAWRLNGRRWLQTGLRLGVLAGISAVLFLPWAVRMIGGEAASVAGDTVSSEEFPRREVFDLLRQACETWSPLSRLVTFDRECRHYILVSGRLLPEGGAGRKMAVVLMDLTEVVAQGDIAKEFVRQVRHDLRSPLTSMRGAVDLLLSGRLGVLDEKQKKLVVLVEKATHQMTDIVAGGPAPAVSGAARKAGQGGGK